MVRWSHRIPHKSPLMILSVQVTIFKQSVRRRYQGISNITYILRSFDKYSIYYQKNTNSELIEQLVEIE